ncbi:MAG: DUF3883 domain-containing protein [Hyphomonadaceae bacterium]|nr:DUF3883 domain-containing protein [Hyphomonadaceae bacterium]
MADEDKIGQPWNDNELDAIVADYFAMLTAELSGQSYVKSHHSAALMAEIGRTHRSVEFKHQNISAVMEELGLPWINGYKPKRNYQNAIFDAIDRYLTRTNWLGQPALEPTAPPIEVAKTNIDIFVPAPPMEAAIERPPRLERLVRKFDPVERDFRNRSLGKAGEAFVLGVERNRLERAMRQDLARNIRWVSHEDGDGAGYDILSFEPDGRERLIEVKTTNGAAKTPFFLTRTEHEVSEQKAEHWRLYRVHFFAQSPRIFTIEPPLAQAVHLRAEAWRASFS